MGYCDEKRIEGRIWVRVIYAYASGILGHFVLDYNDEYRNQSSWISLWKSAANQEFSSVSVSIQRIGEPSFFFCELLSFLFSFLFILVDEIATHNHISCGFIDPIGQQKNQPDTQLREWAKIYTIWTGKYTNGARSKVFLSLPDFQIN